MDRKSLSSPQCSAIMAAKDRQAFIGEAIKSILNQTYQNWELIIVDDHSRDNTLKIAKKYAQQDRRIKLFRATTKYGVAAARNLGINKASGNIIVIADSDDISYPQRLKKTIHFLESHPQYTVFYANVDLYDIDKKTVEPRFFQPFDGELLQHINYIPNTASAFLKEKFLEVGGYDESLILGEDYDLWLNFLNKGYKFGYLEERLVKMTIHTGSVRQEKQKLHKKIIDKIRRKHNLPKPDPKIVKRLARPEVANYFTSPEKLELWFK